MIYSYQRSLTLLLPALFLLPFQNGLQFSALDTFLHHSEIVMSCQGQFLEERLGNCSRLELFQDRNCQIAIFLDAENVSTDGSRCFFILRRPIFDHVLSAEQIVTGKMNWDLQKNKLLVSCHGILSPNTIWSAFFFLKSSVLQVLVDFDLEIVEGIYSDTTFYLKETI